MHTLNYEIPNTMKTIKLMLVAVLAVTLLSGFTSCSSDSGSDNPENINTGDGGGAGLTYDGPAPINDDVEKFQEHLWQNISMDSRCGNCHVPGKTGEGKFARNDDINLAYEAAIDRVNLENPISSLLVTKISNGHECWDTSDDVCAALLTDWIQNWADATGAAATVVNIQPVDYLEPSSSLVFPDDVNGFQTHVWPTLRDYCSDCHAEDGSERQQRPYFASANVNTAYDAAQSRIDLNDAERSRFVTRLDPDLHNCWSSDCAADSEEMQEDIQAFIDTLDEPTGVDPDLVISGALAFPATPDQGQSANTSGRIETNVIAKYEFKQLDQTDETRVVDTSGVDPQLDLRLSGAASFLSSWGVSFDGPDARAQGSTGNSRKLYDRLTFTNQFSVEAWVIPANVSQDNNRRIISYSGGETERNFTLGQTLYNYDTLLRTNAEQGNANGEPLLSTPTADEVLQASLQHVVMNWDPNTGREIYVNGELRSDDTGGDPLLGSNVANWNNAFVLVLGNEAGAVADTDWRGILRFVAIHERTLTPEQIQANFNAGVGQKYYMPFRIDHLDGVPEGGYIVFEVERFDEYSYLFNEPFFTIACDTDTCDESINFPDITIENMRIGVNGRETATGQAYAKMNITITAEDYQAAENNWLRFSSLGGDNNFPVAGTIIKAEKDDDDETTDEFFLTFDVIASETSSVDRDTGDPIAPNVPLPNLEDQQSDIGIKHFYELNELYSAVTGVPKNNESVQDKFNSIKTAMPSSEDPVGFGTSNQMAIAQLAATYCTELVSDQPLRDAMWSPGVNFDQQLNGQDSEILMPLLEKLTAHSFAGSHLASQPDPATSLGHIGTLLDDLPNAQSSSQDDVEGAAIAVCTSVLASALGSVQ